MKNDKIIDEIRRILEEKGAKSEDIDDLVNELELTDTEVVNTANTDSAPVQLPEMRPVDGDWRVKAAEAARRISEKWFGT